MFKSCPLGFIMNSKKGKCIGGRYPFMRTHIKYTASIQRGYWIGSLGNETVVSQCFFCPFNRGLPPNNYILINESKDTNDFFCSQMKRKGDLCQSCIDGYAPAINSEEYKCVKCSKEHAKYTWVLYIIGKFIPITVILILVIIFNISVTSGPANSFIFFAQVISTTFGVDAGRILDFSSITPAADTLRNVYISLYGFWNLNFFESFDVWLYCLRPNVGSLQLLILKYITAIYPLLVLVIVTIMLTLYDKGNQVAVCLLRPIHQLLARCSQILELKYSLMDAFATFLVLSYANFAITSAFLLYPSPLVVPGGGTFKIVSYMDIKKEYFSWEYLPYLTVALMVSIFICIFMPTIILLYSIKPFYHFLMKFKIKCLLPGGKIQHFLNSFHHCYQDGRNGEHDRRYFGSLYLFARLLLLFSFSFAKDWALQLLLQQVFCTVAILAFGIMQPYKNCLYNFLDSIMFGILATINALTFYQQYLDKGDLSLSALCFYIQIILIFIPAIYITIFTICSFSHKQCLKRAGFSGHQRDRNDYIPFDRSGHDENLKLQHVSNLY